MFKLNFLSKHVPIVVYIYIYLHNFQYWTRTDVASFYKRWLISHPDIKITMQTLHAYIYKYIYELLL